MVTSVTASVTIWGVKTRVDKLPLSWRFQNIVSLEGNISLPIILQHIVFNTLKFSDGLSEFKNISDRKWRRHFMAKQKFSYLTSLKLHGMSMLWHA